jgi:hypothetical protein
MRKRIIVVLLLEVLLLRALRRSPGPLIPQSNTS